MTILTSQSSALPHRILNVFAAAGPTDNAHQPWSSHDTLVLIIAAIGIAIVVLLIVRLKMHAFLALTIGSLFVGIRSDPKQSTPFPPSRSTSHRSSRKC